MLHKKKRLWKKYRQSRTVSSRQQYNSMAKHCRAELYNSKIQREREIIQNNNLAQFYKYVNRNLSGRSGIGSLKDASGMLIACLLYTSPSPRDRQKSRMPSSA